jgi:putative membrane protein
MIQYDPHKWMDHFFDVRGSLVKEISGRVGLAVAWALVVYWLSLKNWPVQISPVAHQVTGVALGLLLVFRTNSSYDRFWEARKLWGGMVNDSRNLTRLALAHFTQPAEKAAITQLARLTALFPYAAMHQLRGTQAKSSDADLQTLLGDRHAPSAIALQLTKLVREVYDRTPFPLVALNNFDMCIQRLVDAIGACERIRKTPLPFAYVVHLRRALVVYCFTLPFALLDPQMKFAMVVEVFVISFIFFGIEEIGVEIEGPFGDDANDLDLKEMCDSIRCDVYSLAGLAQAEREILLQGKTAHASVAGN